MDKYVHDHAKKVVAILVIAFLLLAGGEFVIYKKVMQINEMLAEGLMQMKEGKGVKVRPLAEPTQKPTLQLFK
jgi:hypothetical protein